MSTPNTAGRKTGPNPFRDAVAQAAASAAKQPTDLGSTSGVSPPPTPAEMLALMEPILSRVRRTDHWIGTKHWRQPAPEALLLNHFNPARPDVSVGYCPIQRGSSTTRLALLDLDSHKGEVPWPRMVETMVGLIEAGARMRINLIPFRSRGGNGIHLFALWAEPQDARSVRVALGKLLAAEGLKNGTRGVAKGEVEIFPKQDSVPADGWGNMFVLPGAGKSAVLDAASGEVVGWTSVKWVESDPVSVVAPEPPAPREVAAAGPQAYAKVRGALMTLDPNDYDYDGWLRMLFAVHASTEASDEGLALIHEWSAQFARYTPEETDKQWNAARLDKAGGIGWGTLRQAAWNAAGWIDPDDAPDASGFENLAAAPEQGQVRPARFVVMHCDEAAATIDGAAWLIAEVLPVRGLAVAYGAPGSGKTFATMDMAFAVARALPAWHGRKTRQGAVVYVAGEGYSGVRRRIAAYKTEHSVDGVPLGVISDVPNLFTNKGDAALVAEQVKAFGASVGVPVALVILDTLAAVAAGMDENAVKDMSTVISHANAIVAATGATVLVVHHANKAGDMRGSTALLGAADTVLVVSNDGKGLHEILVDKQKDGERGATFAFRLKKVALGVDEDLNEISSCVVEEVGDASPAKGQAKAEIRTAPRPGTMKRGVWDAVIALGGADGAEVGAEQVIDHLRIKSENEGGEFRPKRMRDAINQLVKEGALLAGDGLVTTLRFPPRPSLAANAVDGGGL